ncbi:MAG: hypothetical protein IIY06_12660 [Proteobacteria bacterium]|nr:hypothetical protein [Pseudomonadota bacterium]
MADDLFELLLILILLSVTVLPIVLSIVFGIKLKRRNRTLNNKESQLREIKKVIYKIYHEQGAGTLR